MLKKSHHALTENAGINQAKEGKFALLSWIFKFREVMKLPTKGAVSPSPTLLAKDLPLSVARAVLDC